MREQKEAKCELKQLNQGKKKRSKNTHQKKESMHKLRSPAITNEKTEVTKSGKVASVHYGGRRANSDCSWRRLRATIKSF